MAGCGCYPSVDVEMIRNIDGNVSVFSFEWQLFNRGGVVNKIQYSSLILSHRSKFEAAYTETAKNIDTPVGG
jgi:hypothetical protein